MAFPPTLPEVFRTVEAHLASTGRPGTMSYNLEVKSWETLDGIAHPEPAGYAELVIQDIEASGIGGRVRLQSFDGRIVQEVRRLMPDLCFGLLVQESSALDCFPGKPGFVPDYVNPDRNLADRALIEKLHSYGAKVVVWTVNDPEEMMSLKALGADGIITDHPEIALAIPGLVERKGSET